MAENTKFVIDTSALISFLLPDEVSNKRVKQVFSNFVEDHYTFYAPYLLIYEVGNVLKTATLRNRVSTKDAKDLFEKFLNFPITFSKVDCIKVLDLSIKHDISFYDASYLQLSIQKKADLLTTDKRLAKLLKV